MKGKSKAKATHRFVATIYKLWMMRHVDVPDDVARSLAKELAAGGTSEGSRHGARSSKKNRPVRTKYIPVFVTVNGQEARVTLVPAGGGRYRVQLNTALRKAARADAGDEVSVTLRLDRESRKLEQAATGPTVEEVIAEERAQSPRYGGRSVFGWERGSV